MPRKDPNAPIDYPRQLMIKTKIVQRMMKEVAAYEQEIVDNTDKLNKMESSETHDEYDVKRFKEVLAESVMMVPDSKARLGKNVEDLEVFVDTAKEKDGVKESEWWGVCEEVLAKYHGKENDGGAPKDVPAETNVDALEEGEAF
ncbi:hypothetical protein TrRE_jg7015 [Triparma retinervis]|uniref:Tubulin-specific chaperone A n=1 Tax=Triparma retinervis TaxID=2557542 RepID=A0A9W7G4D7_9STRA|nr:hypothetical protein TrRE_jg7015 [Triparma retinervis]